MSSACSAAARARRVGVVVADQQVRRDRRQLPARRTGAAGCRRGPGRASTRRTASSRPARRPRPSPSAREVATPRTTNTSTPMPLTSSTIEGGEPVEAEVEAQAELTDPRRALGDGVGRRGPAPRGSSHRTRERGTPHSAKPRRPRRAPNVTAATPMTAWSTRQGDHGCRVTSSVVPSVARRHRRSILGSAVWAGSALGGEAPRTPAAGDAARERAQRGTSSAGRRGRPAAPRRSGTTRGGDAGRRRRGPRRSTERAPRS